MESVLTAVLLIAEALRARVLGRRGSARFAVGAVPAVRARGQFKESKRLQEMSLLGRHRSSPSDFEGPLRALSVEAGHEAGHRVTQAEASGHFVGGWRRDTADGTGGIHPDLRFHLGCRLERDGLDAFADRIAVLG